jgi:hypothetical protein
MKSIMAFCATLAIVSACAPVWGDSLQSNRVFIGGTPIIRVQTSAGGYSPVDRASRIQERLNDILATGPIAQSDVVVVPFGDEAVVEVKGQLLFTADKETARYNDSTPMALANIWAHHMRQVLPALTQ